MLARIRNVLLVFDLREEGILSTQKSKYMSYEKALEKIAEEKEKQTGSLDLSRHGLYKIPKELLFLKHLRSLNLSYNKISDIGFLEKMPNLHSLNLRSTKIPSFRFLQKMTKLQSLDISENLIADARFLKKLSNLQSLYINSNGILNPSFLEKLPHLKSLDLSNNSIVDIRFLRNLTSLQSLDISFNRILNPSLLRKLTNIQSLNLTNIEGVLYYPFLEKMTKLQSLDISENQITNASFLGKLTNLQSLSLNSNQITDASFLEKLTNLQSLSLNSNQITNASFLGKLTNLQSLSLNSNKVTDASFLEKLTNLQSLSLNSNKVTDASFLEKLTNLQSLSLNSNKVADYRFLEKLTNLRSLSLSSNKIADYRFLEKLTNLQSLSLRYNQITDASFLEKLINLESLNLSSNKIVNTSFLEKLTNLQSLSLSSNMIADASFLEKMTNLHSLDLSSNLISDISPLLTHIKEMKLQVVLRGLFTYGKIHLSENPISTPPLETVARGNEAIIRFYEDLAAQGKEKLYEAKILIVGDGGAGKTSLAWKMKALDNAMPKEGDDRTKGIDIQAMPIDNIEDRDIPFMMNVWDFGGQGYYHSTHQFFLTKRSLYILMNNTRINKTDFNDWLQTISLFSDSSPVIIVENEVGGSKSELDLRGLQQYFDNILYVRDADISNITDGRLQKLIQDIQIEIQRLPHVGSELPKQWVKIREQLGKIAKEEAYISNLRFQQICRKFEIIEREAMQRLGDLFHDLGIFLHFREDKVLKRIVILQNAWATKGVYTILDNQLVRSQNGYFSVKQAENIWKDTPYQDLYDEMLSLMEKFRLCYRIPYSSPTAYISPNLLPIEKPQYSWDSHQNLIIHYDYEFMPKGLLGMLIVELHRFVKDIKNLAWRSGCIFHYQNTDAQIIETYGKRKLEIRVKGAHCVQLSTIIISEMDKLNASFRRIKVKKLIPCPCRECQRSDTPQFYEYDDLMRRKEKNKRTIECSISYDDIEVLQILEASFNERFAKAPTIRELVAKAEIREAIDVFEEEFPEEGTLLLSRFNHLERYRFLGMISTDDWTIHMQQISNSLLGFSDHPPHKRTENGKEHQLNLHQLDQKLDAIKAQLTGQDKVLNEIIDNSEVQQHELIELLRLIEKKEKDISEAFAVDIITVIERGMTDFMEKVPDAKAIITDWQEASKQLKLTADSKVKLKWTIPFLFMKLEKEVAWNGKDYFRAIKEDIQRGVKGNWSEMFVIKEE